MILLFERNDITKIKVDAIVNAANESLLGGGGVDGAIHAAAGPKLLDECKKLGGCKTGEAKITKGYNLPAKYIIHTVGPIYKDGKHNEKKLLESCYVNALNIAKEKKIHSIAFPLISCGVYGYPKDKGLKVAIDTINDFFIDDDYDITVKIIFYNKDSLDIGSKLVGKIDEYIDDKYARDNLLINENQINRNIVLSGKSIIKNELNLFEELNNRPSQNKRTSHVKTAKKSSTYIGGGRSSVARKPSVSKHSAKKIYAVEVKKDKLEDKIKNLDKGFADTLLEIIDIKNKTDVEIYNKANMDRKLFSKIRSGSHPKKITAISLCIALELNKKETDNLLMKAGYVLNNNDKFDVIISYFIENKKYDLYEINEVLFYYDQPQLGQVK